jgi:hypothetical protein
MYSIYYIKGYKHNSKLKTNLHFDFFNTMNGFNDDEIESIKKLKTNQSLELFGHDEKIIIFKQNERSIHE